MKKYVEYLKEAVAKKITRSDIKVGSDIMTHGYFDDVDLNFKIGKVLKCGEYGNILVEFNESFDKKNLHAGHNNIGKAKHCFYLPLENVKSIDKDKFEEIIKKEQTYSNEAEWWFSNRGKPVPKQ